MQSVFARHSPGTDPVVDVGAHVAGYEVLAHLQSGGMANLFIARRSGLQTFDELVALKVIHERLSEHSNVVRMFVDEANVTSSIRHPNVVGVKELVEHAGRHILVMEYVHGCSLGGLMQTLRRNRRRFSPSAAVAIAMRIAEGLHAAHELSDASGNPLNVVHRDVSPQNILFSQHGDVKICDFGVAKAAQHTAESTVGGLKGKIRYMSPEQATTGQVDRRSDIYSLALVLWEMLTMRRAFKAGHEFQVLMQVCNPNLPAPSAHSTGISAALDAVVMQALDKDPNKRPSSAKAFCDALANAQPRAAVVGAHHLSALIDDVMRDQMEAVLRGLPTDLSRVIELEATQFASAPQGGGTALERLTVATMSGDDDAEDFNGDEDEVLDGADDVSGVDLTLARPSGKPPRLPHLRGPSMRDAMAAIAPDIRSGSAAQSSERLIDDGSADARRPSPSLPAGAFQAAASVTSNTSAPHAADNFSHNAQMESLMAADPADQFNDDMPTSSIQIDPSLKRESGYRAAPPAYNSYPRAGATRPTLPSTRPQPKAQAQRSSAPAPRREEEWNPQALIDEVGLASALPASVPSVREVREMSKKPLFDPKKMTACVDVAPEVMRRAQEMLARGPNPDIMNRPSSELPKGPELKTGKRGAGRPKMPRPEAVKVEQPIPSGKSVAEPGNEQRTRMAERPDEAIAAALAKKTSVTAAPAAAAGGAIPLDTPASPPKQRTEPLEQRISNLGKRGAGTMIADRQEFLNKSRANRGSKARNVLIAATAIAVALSAGVFLSPASDGVMARFGLMSSDDAAAEVEADTTAPEGAAVGSGPVAQPKRVRKAGKARNARTRATQRVEVKAETAKAEEAPQAGKAAPRSTRAKAKPAPRNTRRAAAKAPAKSRSRGRAAQKKQTRTQAADAPAPRRNTQPRQNTRAVDGVPLVRDLSF